MFVTFFVVFVVIPMVKRRRLADAEAGRFQASESAMVPLAAEAPRREVGADESLFAPSSPIPVTEPKALGRRAVAPTGGATTNAFCPSCGAPVANAIYRFCPKCGAAQL